MAVYWLTFRIEADATYSDRYNALIDAIDELSTNWWTEPSSFLLFESDLSLDDVAASAKAAIKPSKDLILIGMPNYKSARVIGALTDPDLFEMMPFTKKA